MARKRAPEGLGAAGRRLWGDISGTYDLRSDELRVLEDTCREADLVAAMQAQIDDAGFEMFVSGSMGQTVINPIVSEIRQHRAVIQRFLAALKLPDGADEAEADDTTSKARAAATARWSRSG